MALDASKFCVVDDDPGILNVLGEVLPGATTGSSLVSGMNVYQTAFAKVKHEQNPFVLVITDLQMPAIGSGIEGVPDKISLHGGTQLILWMYAQAMKHGLPPPLFLVMSGAAESGANEWEDNVKKVNAVNEELGRFLKGLPVLEKPFKFETLLSKINKLLENRSVPKQEEAATPLRPPAAFSSFQQGSGETAPKEVYAAVP